MKTIAELQDIVSDHFEKANFIHEPTELYEPIEYSLLQGGKRLRPVLSLTACQLFGGDIEDVIHAAVGLEIFHNFTLLHDDIMDEAPIRRGVPSVYKKWDTNTAILSGDTMFVVAYDYVTETKTEYLKPILKLFNQTAREVCEGQQYDMNFENRDDVSIQEYMNMIRLKTAVLIGASLKAGAIIAGASTQDCELIYDFGIHIGLGFQLKDDLLDTYGNQAVFGKQIGNDILTHKKTFLLLKAYKDASDAQKAELDRGFSLNKPEDKIATVLSVFNELDIKYKTETLISVHSQLAIDSLDKLSLSDEQKDFLLTFSNKLLVRDK